MMRYNLGRRLGSGGFGDVFKARDLSTGRLFALKVLKQGDRTRESWELVMRLAKRGEATILPLLDHPYIIETFWSAGWGTGRVEIAMDLMHGTLEQLAATFHSPCPDLTSLATRALRQMLHALDYLAFNRLVHRDVKPENIFYTFTPSSPPHPACYHFRLGDFGLCKHEYDLEETHGSRLFMAPEVFGVSEPGSHAAISPQAQTHKSDVWALYVTMLWVLDVHKFRQTAVDEVGCYSDGLFTREIAWYARADGQVGALAEMARVDPAERATAGEMLDRLDRLFWGVGGTVLSAEADLGGYVDV